MSVNSDNWLLFFERRMAGVQLKFVYWLSMLMLVLGLVGLLWAAPVPREFIEISPLLNWGSALLMVSAVYYFIISLPLAIGMLPFLIAIAAIEMWLLGSGLPVPGTSIAAIIAAASGLIIARQGLLAPFRDCMLVMIAPAFLLSLVYRKYGIPI